MTSADPNVRTALYRVYNKADELIYIGISVDPEDRVGRQHRCLRPWGREIDHWTVEWYDERAAAEASEVKAIGAEGPKYNVKETPLHQEVCKVAASLRYRAGRGYRIIVDDVTRRIAEGELLEGSALPTVRELARQHDVSQSTVERAIPVLEDRRLIGGRAGSGRWITAGARRRAQARLEWESLGGWESGAPLPA